MIFISAGHYPTRPGACFEGFCEHDEAMRWSKMIVSMIGEDATLVPTGVLRDKTSFINSRSPSIAVEIHFNSDSSHAGKGCCTLHYPGSSRGKLLASTIQSGLEQIFKRHWDGVMPGYYRMDPKHGPDFFLANTSCPSVIVEPAFIHERELIEENRDAACARIASSLLSVERQLRGT